MASKELFHLLRVLDEHDTGLGRDDVAWAFETATRAESEEWVKTYLTPATLLTKEEFAFHDRFGDFTPQISSAASGRPLSDEDFEHAISSLESSTAAIDAHCQLMLAQKQALLEFKARNTTSTEQGRSEPGKPQQKLARDKAQLDLELTQLSDSLHERLRISMNQAESASADLPLKYERLLEKDDRTLDSLQKIVPKLQENATDSETLDQINKLCHAFTVLETRAIRAKINATYKAGLRETPSAKTNGHTPNDLQEQAAVRAELAELSSEIDGLVALVTENHYRIPITRRIGNARTESHGEAARWSEYLGSTLHYLTARLESLNEQFQHVHAHRAALATISQTLDKTLAAPSTKPEDAQPAVTKAAQAQRGLKPLRLVQANLPEAPDASAQLLRHLDLRQPDPAAPADAAKLSQILQNAKVDRQDNLAAFASSTEESITKLLGESLNKADVDAKDLLGAVFAHSQHGERRLVDQDVQRELDVLEGRTQTVGEQMRRLDMEGLSSEVRRLQRSVLNSK
jgi:hypothetical protein